MFASGIHAYDTLSEEMKKRTHRWQEHDLLVWDDCAVQHNAIGDYGLHQRRLLMRTSVEGTVPV